VKTRPKSGRKRKLTREDEKKILRQAKKKKPATEIAREYKRETRNSVHEQTIRNFLKDQHLHYLPDQQEEELSEVNKQRRGQYSQEMESSRWDTVLFSDEKTPQTKEMGAFSKTSCLGCRWVLLQEPFVFFHSKP